MNAFVSRHPAALALEALSRALAVGARVARRTAAGLSTAGSLIGDAPPPTWTSSPG
jgi:hypothetical protein